jgi:hypothetical protein
MDITDIVLLLIIGGFVFYLLFYNNSKKVYNDGHLQMNSSMNGSMNSEDMNSSMNSEDMNSEDMNSSMNSSYMNSESMNGEHMMVGGNDSNCDGMGHVSVSHDDSNYSAVNNDNDNTRQIAEQRMRGRNNNHFNKTSNGEYRQVSYRSATEKNLDGIDSQFDITDITKNDVDKFEPIDEFTQCGADNGTGTIGAPINIVQGKESVRDKHNLDSFLPKEENKDWFETVDVQNVGTQI